MFAATRWTLILAAQDERSGRNALVELCAIYWYPLYAFARRSGFSQPEAEDLTQEFFARLLAKNYLAEVELGKGRFRSFLLASLRHFIANERDRARAIKRGGGQLVIPLDATSAETRYLREPADTASPDKLFDRQWALTVLGQVLARLRAEFAGEGKEAVFETLKGALTGEEGGYAEIGARLGMSEGAVKVAVHRMRKRYRQLLREEIAQTVSEPVEVDEEIQCLFAALT